ITTSAQTLTAGTCSAAVTVESRDSVGAATPVPSNYTLSFSGSSTSFYSDAGCTTQVFSMVFTAGTSTQTFYLRRVVAGLVTVNASTGFGSANQTETINADVASTLAFSSAA